MRYTSDQQLAAMGLKPLAHLPNRAGFTCIGRLRNGLDVSLRVYKDEASGTFKTVGAPSYDDLIGWRNA